MARQRSVIGRTVGLSLIVILNTALGANAADRWTPEAMRAERARPYAIRAHVSFDPSTRVDGGLRAILLDDWLTLVRRFVGDPWQVDAVNESPVLAAADLEALTAEPLKALGEKVDKVWVIQARRRGGQLVLAGREFDVLLNRLGEIHQTEVRDPSNLPRGLLTLALSLFEPLAEVGESKGGGVTFEIQGGTILPADPVGVVAPVGSVFRAFRLFLDPAGAITDTREIPYSYFRVEERTGSTARCSIIKGIGDPLTGRYARRNKLMALGIQPAMAPTRLRFLLKADKAPAAGFKLVARTATADTKWFDVGITDRDGRIDLPSNFADGLAIVRVLAGSNEPMADLPVMPGETRHERSIVFEARPRTLDLEAKLNALQDAIIDVVATRSRLEARMKARLEGEDLAAFDTALAEFRKLTTRDVFDGQLKEIKTGAESAEAETKTLILTKTARNQIDETQALIDRYLEEDTVRILSENAAEIRANKAGEAPKKGAPAKKATPP